MWDFPDDAGLQTLARDVYEGGGMVASVCHGYCGLFNVNLSDGSLLVKGRRVTGFAWTEEVLAGVAKKVPFNAEQKMRDRGARYEKNEEPGAVHLEGRGRWTAGHRPEPAIGQGHSQEGCRASAGLRFQG